ncbi:MAG TPA: ABC transporter permease [Bryobacteraceae bacterium]|jgi:putative ABC transport system permease protein|nr:ABC transporter permease [Bryobacteraceae bacterium]
MRYAIRTLRRSPGFTAIALLTLALGIGANTAIFSFVNGVLLKPLPYRDPHGIVMVWEKPPGGDRNGISTLNFLDWKNQNAVFEHMAAINFGGSVTLTGAGQPEELQGVRVSASYFDIFGVQAVLGRTFAPDEDQLGKSQVVILSHRLWQDRFGADPSIIGRTLTLSGKPCTVIGVLPAHGPFDRSWAQLWTPLAFEKGDMTRDYHWILSFARLKPGVTIEQAQAAMNAIGARIAAAYPESNKGWGVTVDRLEDQIVGPQLRRSLLVLLAAVGAILLIGCANLANLTLARGAAREREIAVRASLGAGSWRLIRQLLTENLLIAGAGGALGLGLGYAMIRGLIRLAPPYSLPSEADVSIDPAILLFTLAVSLLTALLFGLAPAIHASRVDPASAMKEGGRSTTSGAARARLRNALIVSEVALAFMLLAGAGLLVGSFFRMLQVDTGLTSANVMTARLPIARGRFTHPEQLVQYVQFLDQRLRAEPGVRDVAFSNVLPMQGWGDGMPFLIAGRPFVDRANRRACFYKRVTASYFRALDIHLLRGRAFTDRDTMGGAPVTVINEEMATRYFKGEDPIGKRILIQEILYGQPGLGPEIPWEVVGIVGDEQTGSLVDNKSAGVYVTFGQSPTSDVNMLLRAALDPRTLASAIHAAVHGVDKDQAIADLQTLDQIKSGTVSSDRMQTMLLAIFAGLALLLAAIGIYGVIGYSVTQRTHELGIRAALGASRASLLAMVIRRGMQLTAIGLAIGVAGALALTRLLGSLLFGISPRDPVTLLVVAAVLSSVALLACYIPARRAAGVDPMVALRYE